MLNILAKADPWKVNTILFDVATGIISVHPRLAVSGLATTGVASPSLARYRSLKNMHCTTVEIAYFMYGGVYYVLYMMLISKFF